jgi:hypothetical protein
MALFHLPKSSFLQPLAHESKVSIKKGEIIQDHLHLKQLHYPVHVPLPTIRAISAFVIHSHLPCYFTILSRFRLFYRCFHCARGRSPSSCRTLGRAVLPDNKLQTLRKLPFPAKIALLSDDALGVFRNRVDAEISFGNKVNNGQSAKPGPCFHRIRQKRLIKYER